MTLSVSENFNLIIRGSDPGVPSDISLVRDNLMSASSRDFEDYCQWKRLGRRFPIRATPYLARELCHGNYFSFGSIKPLGWKHNVVSARI